MKTIVAQVPDGDGHNYQKLIDKYAPAPPRPGREREVFIQHDGWCAIYQRELCNCHPLIVIKDKRTGTTITVIRAE